MASLTSPAASNRVRHTPHRCWMLVGFGWLISGCATPSINTNLNPCWTYDQGAPVRGDRSSRQMALVFTGGEHGEGTTHILDVLGAANVRASFFVTGDYLAVPGNPSLVRRMIAEGHYVGPHSHSHPLYCAWDDRDRTLVSKRLFQSDLERNIRDLRELGVLPAGAPVYFIPPYEWYNAEQVDWARELGVATFNFTPGSGSNRDWIPEGYHRFASSQAILGGILNYERRDPHGLNGFLLLLHLGSQRQDKMHLRLSELVNKLRDRGYVFARIDKLLEPAAGT